MPFPPSRIPTVGNQPWGGTKGEEQLGEGGKDRLHSDEWPLIPVVAPVGRKMVQDDEEMIP